MTLTSGNMDIIDESKAVIQSIPSAFTGSTMFTVDMLRLDLIHPLISGNKWYKLKHNIAAAKQRGHKKILTFGGAYSNHLAAAAAAARALNIEAIGVVRGNNAGMNSPTLEQCEADGMQLHFISREEYANKTDAAWLSTLSTLFGSPFIIPEGGANEWGRAGAEEIAALIPSAYTHICVSVGTGTTFTGLRNALHPGLNVLGFAPMKGGTYLAAEIREHLKPTHDRNWKLFDEWHFGGFGRHKPELISFMNNFYNLTSMPLDSVYTSKMMYGLQELLANGYFPNGSGILCIHTGGLQGNSSVRPQLVY